MALSIAQALRVDSSPCIAFIGAGGKTTAMFQLARQLRGPVVVTATSHLGAWQVEMADRHIMTATLASIEQLEHALSGVILVTGELDGDRTRPINNGLLARLHEFCGYHSIPLLIEADGSRQKPLKAWAEHEPPIPAMVRQVIQAAGLSVIGKPLSDESVHRAEIFSNITGLERDAIITADSIAKLLTHENAGLKNIPPQAKRTVLLNQASTPELQSMARGMVHSLLHAYQSVVVADIHQGKIQAVHERIAGIVLAAGQSSRFGEAKQLLDWHGQPFVRAVTKTAMEAGLSPVIVVTGANSDRVAAAVADLNVSIVHNQAWRSGQGSSIKAGILPLSSASSQSTPSVVGGAIFLLTDQPQVTTSVLRALVEKHAAGLYPIVAPMVIDQRANPVLFDRVAFADLLSIEGDVGGRAVFHKHRVEYLPWHDDRILLDVDTPDMYQRLIADDTL